jgi:hypothetical protein
MKLARTWIAVAFLLGAAAQFATAQGLRLESPQVYDDSGPQYLLRAADEDVISREGLDSIGRPTTRDLLGGGGFYRRSEAGIRGGVGNTSFGKNASVNIGFTYLMPLYPFRDFQRPAPRGFEGLFPVFGTAGAANNSFTFVPKIDLNYHVEDLDMSISTAGAFLNLTGHVDRQANQPGVGPEQLNAQSSLTLISAIPIEFGRVFDFIAVFPERGQRRPNVADSLLDLRLGSRYVSVDQNYTSVLTGGANGGNTSNRFSSQSFRGLGITAAAIWQIPVGDNWGPFLSTRQSLAIGENRRNSTVAVTAPGVSFADNQFDNRTIFVPITEVEFGFDWGLTLAKSLRNYPEESLPAFTVRVAAVVQYWYGMGPLSAGANNQGFAHSDLFLVGGYLQAGVKF